MNHSRLPNDSDDSIDYLQLLLFESGELDDARAQQVSDQILACSDSEEYLRELEDIQLAVCRSDRETTKQDTGRLNFVSRALEVSDEIGNVSNKLLVSAASKFAYSNEGIMMTMTGGVALVLAIVSVASIASRDVPDLTASQKSNSASEWATGNVTDSKSKSSNRTFSALPLAKAKKKKINVRTRLLAKIQNTRAKMKTFRRRIQRKS